MTFQSKAAIFNRAWHAVVPDLSAAFSRFPMAILVAALLTAYYLFDLDEGFSAEQHLTWRPFFGLLLSFFWSLIIGLLCEACGHNTRMRWTLLITGYVVIALLTIYAQTLDLLPPLPIAAALVATGLAAHARHDTSNDGFWVFNHQLWFGALLALAGATLFAVGASIIVETLKYLFDIRPASWMHEKIWIVAMGLITPVTWLTLVPREFNLRLTQTEPEFTSRALAILVGYILVPLLLVYTAILYAYGIKILIDGDLPKGRLGWMVLCYGGIGTLTALMAYPEREHGRTVVRFFWRYWFLLTIVPIVLLLVAGHVRIADYGVTTERYLIMLNGLWLSAVFVIYALPNRARDLRHAPIALVSMLLFASLGPWGASGWSVRSQISELQQLLKQVGVIKNAQIVQAEQWRGKIDFLEGARINSILRYLDRHERLDEIRPWFMRLENSPFRDSTTIEHTKPAAGQNVRDRIANFLGISAEPSVAQVNSISFYANLPAKIDLTTNTRLYGPIQLNSSHSDKPVVVDGDTTPMLSIWLKRNALEIEDATGQIASFSLLDMVEALESNKPRRHDTNEKVRSGQPPMAFRPNHGLLNITLVLTQFNGQRTNKHSVDAYALGLWLIKPLITSPIE